MEAKAYNRDNEVRCTFRNLSDEVCSAEVSAVYVSDDDLKQARPVCQEHAKYAEREGDGPVYYIVREGSAYKEVEQDDEEESSEDN